MGKFYCRCFVAVHDDGCIFVIATVVIKIFVYERTTGSARMRRRP